MKKSKYWLHFQTTAYIHLKWRNVDYVLGETTNHANLPEAATTKKDHRGKQQSMTTSKKRQNILQFKATKYDNLREQSNI
jgi:hypothetical protein